MIGKRLRIVSVESPFSPVKCNEVRFHLYRFARTNNHTNNEPSATEVGGVAEGFEETRYISESENTITYQKKKAETSRGSPAVEESTYRAMILRNGARINSD